MKKTKIICDGCGNEIPEDLKDSIHLWHNDTWGFIKQSQEVTIREDMDFCNTRCAVKWLSNLLEQFIEQSK